MTQDLNDSARMKRAKLEELLEQGMVLIALDARKGGVDVPEHLAHDLQLRLNLSYRFGLPIAINDWGVHVTLTFNGALYACKLPWSSIFLVVSHVGGEPILFAEDLPKELLEAKSTEVAEPIVSDKPKTRLKLVSEVSSNEAKDEETKEIKETKDEIPPVTPPPHDEPPKPTSPPRRGHLRLVK